MAGTGGLIDKIEVDVISGQAVSQQRRRGTDGRRASKAWVACGPAEPGPGRLGWPEPGQHTRRARGQEGARGRRGGGGAGDLTAYNNAVSAAGRRSA
jgi:hypothetical protein